MKTRKINSIKLILPFPYFLWMNGTHPNDLKEALQKKPRLKQENVNMNNADYEGNKE